MTNNDMTYQAFLCHSSVDKERIRRLAQLLKSKGIKVWFDEWNIRPGDSIPVAIEHGLEQSQVLILCMSTAFFESEWTTYERATAIFRDPTNRQRRFIPLLLEDTKVPQSLNQFRYIDWRQESTQQREELLKVFAPTTLPSSEVDEIIAPYPEIETCLKRLNIKLASLDGYVEICRSPSWRGWPRGLLAFDYVGDYEPFEEFKRIIDQHPFEGGSLPRYGLRAIKDMPLLDDHSPLRLQVLGGWYDYVYALSREADPNVAKNPSFRGLIEDKWWPLDQSQLWHNINCQVVVVTLDRKLVMMKRSPHVRIYPGRWSVGIEEQMNRTLANRPGDIDIFSCAERGVFQELGIKLHTHSALLISIGLEWLNFSASFILIGRVTSTSSQIVKSWSERATDKYEAVVLDFIPATVDGVNLALAAKQWGPTDQVATTIASHHDLKGEWHPTARARLLAYRRHIENSE